MKTSIFKDSFLYGLSSVVSKIIAFLLIPIYTSVFSVEDYGTIGILASIMGIVGIFMQVGSNNSLQRFYFDEKNDQYKKIVLSSGFMILLLSSTLIFIVLIVFSENINAILYRFSIPYGIFLIALSSLYLNQYIIFTKEIMRIFFLPKKYFLFDFIPVLVTAAVTITLLYTIEKSLYVFYIGLLVGSVFGLVIAMRSLIKNVSFLYDSKTIKDMFKFGYPFVFVGLAYWVFQSSDRIMIAELSAIKEVGLYHIASQFSVIMYIVITAFGASWGPYAMKLYNGNSNHKYIYSKFATLWILFLSFVSIAVSAFIGDLLIFMTTEEYYQAEKIIPILIFGIFMNGTTQFSVLGISIVKKTMLISRYSWMIAILNILLNLLLIPYYNALGAAIATSLSSLILTALYLQSSQREYFINYEYTEVFVIVLITLVSILLFLFISISMIVKAVYISFVLILYWYIANKKYLSLKAHI